MNIRRIIAIIFIFAATTAGWFILGGALTLRTEDRSGLLGSAVDEGWGPPLTQLHPATWYLTPGAAQPAVTLPPSAGDVHVQLDYEPKKRGLMWYRTFSVQFSSEYVVVNPSPVTQTIYVRFQLPVADLTYRNFSLRLGDAEPSERTPENGVIVEAVSLAAGASVPLRVAYEARGTGAWKYEFGGTPRVRNFTLQMLTNFDEIDFPVGTASPTERDAQGQGWSLVWKYPDVLSPGSIGMEMPSVLNAGPVAARISFFAPVGLLFFFAVVLILGAAHGRPLHPMNYFFLAAGFFAFQLLFAYLVDLLPLLVSFIIAASVSLALVGGYIHGVTHGRMTRLVVIAQFAYMVLFSYSFFFDGLTGLTITIGAIATLALLMRVTARIDWSEKFGGRIPAPLVE